MGTQNSSNNTSGVNKGKVFISHGDNVITFPVAHADTNYKWKIGFVQSAVSGITPRNVRHTAGLTIFTSNESTTRGKVRIEGGYGFTSCGDSGGTTNYGTHERFDDVANSHTARTADMARRYPAGYSLSGYGFTSTGLSVSPSWVYNYFGTTYRFDDIANGFTSRADATARYGVGGYAMQGYGYTTGGYTSGTVGTTERFDDIANTHTARTAITSRQIPGAYSLNGYGFSSCGYNGINAGFGTTERFDDTANTHTARTLATVRHGVAACSLNGYGFTLFGSANTTERFDDIANTHTARTAGTSRQYLAGFSLNGCAITCAGSNSNTTERFDDIANTHTARTAGTGRFDVTGNDVQSYFIEYYTYDQ
jgi:hypothetical protein